MRSVQHSSSEPNLSAKPSGLRRLLEAKASTTEARANRVQQPRLFADVVHTVMNAADKAMHIRELQHALDALARLAVAVEKSSSRLISEARTLMGEKSYSAALDKLRDAHEEAEPWWMQYAVALVRVGDDIKEPLAPHHTMIKGLAAEIIATRSKIEMKQAHKLRVDTWAKERSQHVAQYAKYMAALDLHPELIRDMYKRIKPMRDLFYNNRDVFGETRNDDDRLLACLDYECKEHEKTLLSEQHQKIYDAAQLAVAQAKISWELNNHAETQKLLESAKQYLRDIYRDRDVDTARVEGFYRDILLSLDSINDLLAAETHARTVEMPKLADEMIRGALRKYKRKNPGCEPVLYKEHYKWLLDTIVAQFNVCWGKFQWRPIPGEFTQVVSDRICSTPDRGIKPIGYKKTFAGFCGFTWPTVSIHNIAECVSDIGGIFTQYAPKQTEPKLGDLLVFRRIPVALVCSADLDPGVEAEPLGKEEAVPPTTPQEPPAPPRLEA